MALMTPDQALKSAIMGEAEATDAKSVKAPKARREKTARRKPSRRFRWTVRLLVIALMLLVTRGLMQAPEIKAMIAEAVGGVTEVVATEVAAREKEQVAEALEEARNPDAPEPVAMPVGAASAIPVSAMPQDRITVRRPEPQTDETTQKGPVTAIYAANLLDVDGVTLVINKVACPRPDTEEGRIAALGLARLTQSQTLTCVVTGQVGPDALSADCKLRNGKDLGAELLAQGHCS